MRKIGAYLMVLGSVAIISAKTEQRSTFKKTGIVRLGQSNTYLKEGLTVDEVVRFLGEPLSISGRDDAASMVVTYVFERGEGRILVAEFVNGTLVRSRTEIRTQVSTDIR